MFSSSKEWRGLGGAAVLTGGSLLTLAYLRPWAFLAAAWAAAIAVWLFHPARPAIARGLCALLCIVLPVLPGLGLAGSTYVHRHGGSLGYERGRLAHGAKSAFVHPVPLLLPDEQLKIPEGLGNDLRALPRGLVAFTLRPFPWQHGGGASYDFASIEELLYYPLYLLAAVGLVAYRHRRDVIAFPFLVIILITGVASEAEGNIGSAFRHRDQLLWALVLLAALGAQALLSSRSRLRGPANVAGPGPR
jgi:hypothetical protein